MSNKQKNTATQPTNTAPAPREGATQSAAQPKPEVTTKARAKARKSAEDCR